MNTEQAFFGDINSPNIERQIDAVIRGDLTSVLSPETLASRWGIGQEIARRTLDVTTQLGMRAILHPTQRHFRTAMPHLRYPHLKGTYYANTLFLNTKSARGFRCANVIGDGVGFTKFWPMVSKADSHESLQHFVQDVGILEQFVTDSDHTMTYKAWKAKIKEYRITQTTPEPCLPWQNCAELDVRAVKRGTRWFTRRQDHQIDFGAF